MYRQIVLYDRYRNHIYIRVTYDTLSNVVSMQSRYIDKDKQNKRSKQWREDNLIKYKQLRVKYDHKYYKEHQLIMKGLKINGCAICGYNTCDRALSFHHVNPKDKSFSMCIMCISRRSNDLVKELNKCILLCANCHMEIHERLNRP